MGENRIWGYAYFLSFFFRSRKNSRRPMPMAATTSTATSTGTFRVSPVAGVLVPGFVASVGFSVGAGSVGFGSVGLGSVGFGSVGSVGTEGSVGGVFSDHLAVNTLSPANRYRVSEFC